MSELLQAAKAVIDEFHAKTPPYPRLYEKMADLRAAVERAEMQEAMRDAIDAGDGILLNEQAALLRECRKALDDLINQNPMLAAKVCGSTTLGNLKAHLYAYRPRSVFGGAINE